MVARHTRRTTRHRAGDCVCIDCGTRYLFTNTYKGNYCLECHDQWVERQRSDSPVRTPPRLRPATRREHDETTDADRPYDVE